VKRLLLTSAGLKVLRKAVARAVIIERQMFSGLSSKEKNDLRTHLRQCLRGISHSGLKKAPKRGAGLGN
jgi:DNA-binding MarR family transcriptional regulator